MVENIKYTVIFNVCIELITKHTYAGIYKAIILMCMGRSIVCIELSVNCRLSVESGGTETTDNQETMLLTLVC